MEREGILPSLFFVENNHGDATTKFVCHRESIKPNLPTFDVRLGINSEGEGLCLPFRL
jgi:hypothetical protein